ncbi:MFS transporter [Alphaproteobacteria bacterium KMM 3653]|uniref:MFS transporter n=1 Tax=Harenicola maris TaxID=2841044 RepID=A0AAP2CLQ7_9RHOB|nr:MFS transporter [Harenicola maris]
MTRASRLSFDIEGDGPYVLAHGAAQLCLWSAFYYVLPALSAPIVKQTGWPLEHVTWTYTFAFLVWALCAPLVGIGVDRGHGRRQMQVGGLLGAGVLVCLSLVQDRWMFSALVLLLGVSMAATLYDPCFSMMMRRLRARGADAVASVTLIAGFATLLSFPAVQGLMGVMGWQQIVLVFAALAVLGVVLLPKEAGGVAPAVSHPAPSLRIGRGPALIALAFGLVMLGHGMLLFLLPVVLAGSGGGVVLALAILGPAQIAGRLAWRAFGPRSPSAAAALVLFGVLCLPPLILGGFGPMRGVVYGALALQGACYGVHTILRPILAQQYLAPDRLGRGLGGVAMVGLLMMAFGPALGGVIWGMAGFGGLMVAVLALNLCAFGVGLALLGVRPLGVSDGV